MIRSSCDAIIVSRRVKLWPTLLKANLTTRAEPIGVGDRVLLRYKDRDPFLTAPLEPTNGTTSTHLGDFNHGDIIGKLSRDTIRSHNGHEVRVHVPTLAEYVTLTPRMVTPIYPADATLITSVLDVNISHTTAGDGSTPLEILEAGTGHGSLTLHLARAVHAANSLNRDLGREHDLQPDMPACCVEEGLYKAQRQAVVHTVDVSKAYSKHAQSIVRGFRRGIYANDVDFYISNVSDWIDRQLQYRRPSHQEDRAFLSHIILDMPNGKDHIAKASSVLHTDGNLLVFNPSISQIMSVVQLVKRLHLPLVLDRVLELGHNLTGGREWDVRSVAPRAHLRNEFGISKSHGSEASLTDRTESQDPVSDMTSSNIPDERLANESELHMVCRPKVGGTVIGGGFVGVWKKMKDKS